MYASPYSALLGVYSQAGNSALLKFYSSPAPAPGGDPDTATLLATLTMGSPLGSFTEDATYHILTLAAASPDLAADADGTATWARLTTAAGTYVADFTVTTTGNGGDITMPTTVFYIGGQVSMVSGVIKVAK